MLTLLWTLTACSAGVDMLDGAHGADPAQAAVLTQVRPMELTLDQEALIDALLVPETRDQAHRTLAAQGRAVVPTLLQVIHGHPELPARGYAIQVLADIPGPDTDLVLEQIQYGDSPGLVQAWAGAARIHRAESLAELLALADTVATQPALERPFEQRARALADQLEDVSAAIQAMATGPAVLQTILAPAVLAQGPADLVDAMLYHPNDPARRLAAGLLGTLDQQQRGVGAVVAAALVPDPSAEQVPWRGGALYVPALQWRSADAQVLVGHLISWHVFCDVNGLSSEQAQIMTNLRSIQLVGPAGFSRNNAWPDGQTEVLIAQWSRIHGRHAARDVLRPWGLEDSDDYTGRLP